GASFFAGGFKTGILKSSDHGMSWTKVSDASLVCEAVYAILVDPIDPAHLYLGGNGAGIWESSDGGRKWKQTGLEGMHIMNLGIYP
ncbi:MAG TPA: hypothetical protein VK470_11015, partial [Bacteroidota bacterium]|nr:hypothetical protein [Bacteroidota bacterium]